MRAKMQNVYLLWHIPQACRKLQEHEQSLHLQTEPADRGLKRSFLAAFSLLRLVPTGSVCY
jgi:hypothetical protein